MDRNVFNLSVFTKQGERGEQVVNAREEIKQWGGKQNTQGR